MSLEKKTLRIFFQKMLDNLMSIEYYWGLIINIIYFNVLSYYRVISDKIVKHRERKQQMLFSNYQVAICSC